MKSMTKVLGFLMLTGILTVAGKSMAQAEGWFSMDPGSDGPPVCDSSALPEGCHYARIQFGGCPVVACDVPSKDQPSDPFGDGFGRLEVL